MDHRFLRFLKLSLILLLALSIGCKERTNQNSNTHDKPAERIYESYDNKEIKEQSNKPFSKYHAKPEKKPDHPLENNRYDQIRKERISQKIYDVLEYVLKNKRAPDNYVGGRRFGNFEGHLPRQNLEGRRIEYQEWDVNPKKQGRNRGVERLVTGSDGRAWYKNDHYNSFTEIK